MPGDSTDYLEARLTRRFYPGFPSSTLPRTSTVPWAIPSVLAVPYRLALGVPAPSACNTPILTSQAPTRTNSSCNGPPSLEAMCMASVDR